MNGFKKRSIRRWGGKTEHWMKGHLILTVIALILGVLTLKGIVGAVKVGNPFSVKQIVISAITNGIDTDRSGHTNILLIGIGGEGHDGANLTDTMILASIDHKQNLIPMLSIPRDFYVENDAVGWGTRINSVYEYVLEETGSPERAMEELVGEIEDITNMDIQYYAKVDFQGFTDIVDAIGGIDITLTEAFYDPFYPADYPTDEQAYQEFYLAAGEHTLNGDDALKYVRSRKTTSDFDRGRRQQEVINAIKEKAMSIGFLFNPSKIKKTISAISSNFDTNLSITEMVNLASMSDEFSSDSIITQVLHDDASQTGGFLYTPDREEYGGAFVLAPYSGDNWEIQMFSQLYFYHPEIYKDQISIEVLNSTGEPSLAGLTKMYLHRYGFNIVEYGNGATETTENTRIFPADGYENNDTLEILPALTYGEVLKNTPEEYSLENWDTNAEIILELGQDFVKYYEDHAERFYLGLYY